MTLRVTFDTNVLDFACRPERYSRDPRQPELQKVRDALAAGTLQGFYSVTMLTIEGIMRADRAAVFAGTQTKRQPETYSTIRNADLPDAVRALVGDEDIETLSMRLVVEQPDRKPLHPEVVARMTAAQALSVRVLQSVPRLGAYRITDPENKYYLDNGEGDAKGQWIEKAHEVSRAIEARGLGYAQVKLLGEGMAAAADPQKAWFKALDNAKNIHEERAVERAFSEWADGDSIASHVAYGLDVFCSDDIGQKNVKPSVLNQANRSWLTDTYGIKFMSFDDLLASLP